MKIKDKTRLFIVACLSFCMTGLLHHQLGFCMDIPYRCPESSDRVPSPDGHSSQRKHFTAVLALTCAWTIPGQPYGSHLYQDYVRIYAPPGSILDRQTGLKGNVALGFASVQSFQAFGHRVWAGFFMLRYGQTQIITLVWSVPHAALQDTSGWHYQYLIQRQAGAQWTLHLSITLPSCAVMSTLRGGLVKQPATLTQPLNEDMEVGIDYGCQ